MRFADQGLVTLVEPLTIEPIGIAISPGDSLMVNMVQNYLVALEAVGVLDEHGKPVAGASVRSSCTSQSKLT